MRNVTIREIKSLYLPEQKSFERYNLWLHYVLRPISYYLAWLLLKLGVTSANKVSWTSLVIGFAGCVWLAFGNYWLMIVGAVLVNIWALLDCVDGAVARYNKVSNVYGKITDSTCDYLMALLLFTGAGIAAYNYPDSTLNSLFHLFGDIDVDRGVFLFLGGWASFFFVFPKFISSSLVRFSLESGRHDVVAELRKDVLGGFPYLVAANLYGVCCLVMPILLLATIFGFLDIFILLWAVLNTSAGIFLLIQVFRKARLSV